MDEVQSRAERHPVAAVCDRFGGLLDELGGAVLWSASDAEVADIVAAAEQVCRRAAAVRATAVGEAERRELPRQAAVTGATAWLSGLLGAAPQRAKRISRLGQSLAVGVEATRQALAAGTVDADQAQVIAAAVHRLPAELGDEVRAKAEAYLLDQAELHHAGVLAGLAAHLLEVVAPEVAEARLAEQLEREESADRRRNRLSAVPNWRGRVSVRGDFDPESWATVAAALSPFTKPIQGHDLEGAHGRDPRTYDQRLGDGLVELACRALHTGDLPVRGGKRPQLVVTIGYEQLIDRLGLALLDTGVAVTPETARRIGCDAQVISAVLGADGVPLDVGRSSRLFENELRDALVLRDRGCAFPGCDRPPSWCEGHHIVHWIDGGRTCLACCAATTTESSTAASGASR